MTFQITTHVDQSGFETTDAKRCSRCKETKPVAAFCRDRSKRDGLFIHCRQCSAEHHRVQRAADPEKFRARVRAIYAADPQKYRDRQRDEHVADPRRGMLANSKTRARAAGLGHSLALDQIAIPTRCPVLGIPLVVSTGKGGSAGSPSLDRIDPRDPAGYSPGNSRVISTLANRIKNDHSPESLRAYAARKVLEADGNADKLAALVDLLVVSADLDGIQEAEQSSVEAKLKIASRLRFLPNGMALRTLRRRIKASPDTPLHELVYRPIRKRASA
jgi:hypothetical protein